jgi:hypothetical protein
VRPVAALLALALATSTAQADPPPALVLWAWERPEDLRFAPASVGVAYLRATVDVRPTGVRVAPRRQPLHVRAGAFVLAVVRVEARPRATELTPAVRARIVEQLVDAARAPGVRGVQIDFDAGASQRRAYHTLLAEARQALPAGTWLSMTALASWCEGDAWLDAPAMPVDEVVPMVFAMGREGPAVLGALRSRGRFRSRACGASVGWAVGEPSMALAGVTRRYVFNPRAWTAATLRSVR